MTKHTLLLAALLGVTLGASGAARADLGLRSTLDEKPRDRGGAIVGLKVGGALTQPFSNLGGSYYLELEAGYMLPYLRRLLSVTVSAGLSAPSTSGSASDSRVPGGSFTYEAGQTQVGLGLTLTARVPLGRIVPYVGVGPRLILVRTQSSGVATAAPIDQSSETSTEIGIGVPVGVDFLLGPGRIFAEGQLLWTGIAQRSSGESSLGAINLCAGYRFVL